MDDVFWVVRHGTPVLATTLGINRSWHHLRSGSDEWKEQCPRKFDKESQAWWHILMCEVSHAKWTGWHAANNRVQMIDHVRDTNACERIYDVCFKYNRAFVSEITPKKDASNDQ